VWGHTYQVTRQHTHAAAVKYCVADCKRHHKLPLDSATPISPCIVQPQRIKELLETIIPGSKSIYLTRPVVKYSNTLHI